MRWRRRRPPTPAPSPEAQDALAEAREARETSEQGLQEVCERWPEVREVTSSLRAHRERNGFRAMFERALLKEGEA
ncbi:hypothetical protein FHR32_005140 [Streptosporangium album]|uniref:Uncharacterized protein n=1 Tax=Streptosporangium album TaxID=47479 RepID=A0A7W7S028_9ACTN|nr:hypothetical protein [Streptosporangium album]MBB4940763.1 hypothetical protein [Streptosporangium album]